MMKSNSPDRLRSAPQTCKGGKTLSFPFDKSANLLTHSHKVFISELEKEIQRLDTCIILDCDEKSAFGKILSAVKQSVEFILMIQARSSYSDRTDVESLRSGLRIQEAKVKNEAERVKITSKHLEQYDLLLKAKEEQLQREERAINIKTEALKEDDLCKEELKLKIIQLEQELRLIRKKNINESQMLQKSNNKVEWLKGVNDKLKGIVQKSSSRHTVSEISSDKELLSKEKKKLERVKRDVSQLKTSIEKERARIAGNSIDNTKHAIHESYFWENSINFSEISCGNYTERPNQIESRGKELDYRENLLFEAEKEMKLNILQVKEQIEEYNIELEIKESELERLIELNRNREQEFYARFTNLKLIENSLQSSKSVIDELYSEILPKFEAYSQALSQLLADLYSKKQAISDNFNKINKIADTLEIHEACLVEEEESSRLEYQSRLEELKKAEDNLAAIEANLLEKESNLDDQVAESITKLSKELEERLQKVKEKELELERIKETVEVEKTENEKIAMMLKVSHLELENNKIKQAEKFRIKQDKLKFLKSKLEQAKSSQEKLSTSSKKSLNELKPFS